MNIESVIKEINNELLVVKNLIPDVKQDFKNINFGSYIVVKNYEEAINYFREKIIKIDINEKNNNQTLIDINLSNEIIIKSVEKIIKVETNKVLEIECRKYSNDSLNICILTSVHKFNIVLVLPRILVVEEKFYLIEYSISEVINNIVSKINNYLKNYLDQNSKILTM